MRVQHNTRSIAATSLQGLETGCDGGHSEIPWEASNAPKARPLALPLQAPPNNLRYFSDG
jgi:hypothetical protein